MSPPLMATVWPLLPRVVSVDIVIVDVRVIVPLQAKVEVCFQVKDVSSI